MAGKKSYKTLLIQARELRSEAGKNAYRRATILVQVFDDREFRAEAGALDDHAAASVLDREVEDLCLTFLQMREILAEFPNESEWADGRLRTLYEKTCERVKLREKESREDAPAIVRRKVTIKELDAAETARQEAEASAKSLQRQVEEIRSSAETMKQDNERLRLENERLKGRIEELERGLARRAA